MSKFITEIFLKELYKKKPFENYELEKNERLTPGAQEYLRDKNIKIESYLKDNESLGKKYESEKIIKNSKNLINQDEILGKVDEKENNKEISLEEKKLFYKLNSIEVLLFNLAGDILQNNLSLAQKIMDIGRDIKSLRDIVNGECKIINIEKPCDNDLEEKKLEITDVYVYSRNKKEIFDLYYLYCELNIIKCSIIEIYQCEDKENSDMLIKGIQLILKKISEIVYKLLGGVKC